MQNLMSVNQILHEFMDNDVGQSYVGKKGGPLYVDPCQDKFCIFQDGKGPTESNWHKWLIGLFGGWYHRGHLALASVANRSAI